MRRILAFREIPNCISTSTPKTKQANSTNDIQTNQQTNEPHNKQHNKTADKLTKKQRIKQIYTKTNKKQTKTNNAKAQR